MNVIDTKLCSCSIYYIGCAATWYTAQSMFLWMKPDEPRHNCILWSSSIDLLTCYYGGTYLSSKTRGTLAFAGERSRHISSLTARIYKLVISTCCSKCCNQFKSLHVLVTDLAVDILSVQENVVYIVLLRLNTRNNHPLTVLNTLGHFSVRILSCRIMQATEYRLSHRNARVTHFEG